MEKVFFVVKKVSGGRAQFAVATYGERVPQGFFEVSRPRTRTLSRERALRRARRLQEQAAARVGRRSSRARP